MARPLPNQNVSFKDAAPPSRRAPRDETPPRPPAKNLPSKSSLSESATGSTSYLGPAAPAVAYDDGGYVDVGGSNPQGFSASNGADVRRKKSMVKPERERIDPNHRLWHYRERAAEDQMNVMPSCKLFCLWILQLISQQPGISHMQLDPEAPIFVAANHFLLVIQTSKPIKDPVSIFSNVGRPYVEKHLGPPLEVPTHRRAIGLVPVLYTTDQKRSLAAWEISLQAQRTRGWCTASC